MAYNPGTPWLNCIVGHGEEAPGHLLANPRNFWIHPSLQQNVLRGVLSEIGWLQEVIVNVRSSDLWPPEERGIHILLDGHLRVNLSLQSDQPSIPVKYVDLSPLEEAEALATFDPLSALAETDKEKLDALLREVQSGDSAVQEMLAGLARREGLYTGESSGETGDAVSIPSQYLIMIECESEAEQTLLLENLLAEGVRCKALIS